MNRRISAAFDTYIDASSMSDDDGILLSRELGLDIAVNLNGHTGQSRTGFFAGRCAPVQVNFLGYPGSMGAEYMDYIIADHTLIPAGCEKHYTEKVVYMPHSFQPNDSKRKVSSTVFRRAEFGLPEKGFVFCCFNNSYKILPGIFDNWMRILKAVTDSVLWLREDNVLVKMNLVKEAQLRGVDGSRILFTGRIKSNADHLARQKLGDLFLDTLPYNAHTTASDALWAGLPVLTLIGEAFPGRVSASLLNAVGLPELITSTGDEFVERAIELATEPCKLQAIREKLLKNTKTTPLFNGRLYCKHLELAYEKMYARSLNNQAPETIEISPESGSSRVLF